MRLYWSLALIPLFVLFVLDPTHQLTRLPGQMKYLAKLHLLMLHTQSLLPLPSNGKRR